MNIVVTGVHINTNENTVLFSVALQKTQKLGLYNFAELEDNQTPDADTRFTTPEANVVAKYLAKHNPILNRPRLIRILPTNNSKKLNAYLLQYEIDSIKLLHHRMKRELTKLGRAKEFKF